jgi:hypothetical protein
MTSAGAAVASPAGRCRHFARRRPGAGGPIGHLTTPTLPGLVDLQHRRFHRDHRRRPESKPEASTAGGCAASMAGQAGPITNRRAGMPGPSRVVLF